MNTEKKLPITLSGAFFIAVCIYSVRILLNFFLICAAAAAGSAAFITAETTATPAIGLSDSTSMLSAFSPPIATTGIGTARQTSFSTETGVTLVVTCVVVGKIAPVPR